MDGSGSSQGEVAPPARPADVERRLTRYVAALTAVAVIVPVVVVLVAPVPSDPAGWPLAVALALAVLATELFHVKIRVGPTLQSTTLVELAVVPVVLLFAPATAVVLVAVAGLAAELLLRQTDLRKLLFNLSWHVTGAALAAWTFTALVGGATFDDTPRSIGAALVAGAVFIGWNLLTFAGIVVILSGRRLWCVLRDESLAPVLINAGTAVLGILVALLILEAPAALPLLVLLGLLIHQRQRDEGESQERLEAERDRFARTLAGSSDGVVLLDAAGTVEVWNPAMASITGIDEGRAVGADLEELGWARLLAAPTPGEEEVRVTLATRVLAVRRADVPGTRSSRPSTVLTVRDVSREAELSRIREDLVMRISHELRTPLTSVEGFLEVLATHWDRLGDDGRRELLEASQRGSRRLSRLVSNLMVWAGIESRAGAATPAEHPSDVVDLLADVVDELDVPPAAVRLRADGATAVAVPRDDLHTVLTNLLSNAALYGAPPISVEVRRRGAVVELEVADAGPGLPADFRPQLFEPFSQGSDGLRRTSKGLGMGLAIVRAVAQAYGGGVRYEDAAGGGARFTVTLPAAHPQVVVLPPEATSGSESASGTSSSSR